MRPFKTIELDNVVSRLLRLLRKVFESGDLDENNLINADETHFAFHMDK